MWHWIFDFVLIALLVIFMIDGLTFLWVKRVYQIAYHIFIRVGGLLVIFVDLDNFKQINDRFGHRAGDRILRKIGLVLLKEARFRAFRYGGDEFVILLPWATEEQAAKLAERIQCRIAEINIDGIKISVSIGIGRNEEKADAAVYEAKKRKPR